MYTNNINLCHHMAHTIRKKVGNQKKERLPVTERIKKRKKENDGEISI